MKHIIRASIAQFFLIGWLVTALAFQAYAQTTSITYQGKLTDNGNAANGTFDLEFKLFDALTAGTQQGATLTREDVVVANGVFTVQLDFGAGAFPGAARFLDIGVRYGAQTGEFTPLTPRQPVLSTPYAVRSLSAGSADNATQLGGVAATNYLQGVAHDATLTGNGTTGAPLGVVSSGWLLTGNAGVNPATNFLGTTDNQPVVFRTNGAELMRLSAAGRIGIGLTAPGEKLHLGDGNFLLEGGGETAVKIKRDITISGGPSGTSQNPIFELGRIIQAGDGDPEFRFLYSDDNTPPRAVFEFDRKGIVASVKPARGSHFEGFISNTDPQPIFRLNSFPKMRLEMGDGGTTPVDVAVQREAASTLTFLTGNAERVRIDANGNLGVGTTTPTSRLHVAGDANVTTGLTVGGTITGNGSGLTNLNAGNISTGALLTARGGTGLSAAGAAGNYLRSDGTAWTSSALPAADVPDLGASYIRNTTTQQAASNFNISGNGTAGGTLSGNLVNAAAQYNLGGNRILSNAGANNLFAGVGAGAANTLGTDNAFFGFNAGLNNTGNLTIGGRSNSYFGTNAGQASTQGRLNSYFGANAGSLNTFGFENSFFGAFAGSNNSGDQNSFFGVGVGASNTASGNSFFGHSAGANNTAGMNNAFFGSNAGAANTIGSSNTFFGRDVGLANTGGSASVFVGRRAGSANLTGGFNTIIGTFADVGAFDLTYATAIGAEAVVTSSNKVQLGRVGADRVAIGAFAASSTSDHVCINGLGEFTACSSSQRYKQNVQPLRSGLKLIQRLRPVTFDWKESHQPDLGLIAEEVAAVEPLLNTYNHKGEIEGVKYDQLTVVLINAVKEQQTQIAALQQQVADLQKRLDQKRPRARKPATGK